jgi:hypothetical protein
LISGIYGGALGYSISSSMQSSATLRKRRVLSVEPSVAPGRVLSPRLLRKTIGAGIFLSAWAGAAGAATANAVSGWLNLINQDFGDCGCGK